MIRIGYASGYWGDDPNATERMLENPPSLEYVAMDYLAETTMAILKRQHESDASLGYARDFPTHVGSVLEEVLDQDITVLANAGGVNPQACRDALLELAREEDAEITVAAIDGDDISDRLSTLRENGVTLENMDTGRSFHSVEDDLVSANAYLGAFPIADALSHDPDVVVTGRCVDAALVMGPLIHEYGWSPDEYDKLAGGAVAGHVLECGTQATGGVFTDWQEIDFTEMGFPIAEVEQDGSFVVTKSDDTGGAVTIDTVKEQLVYEIKDPARHELPDVTVDFTTPELADQGDDRVSVTNCTGSVPPDSYKVSALYRNGYKGQLLWLYSWPDALAKARKGAEIVRDRVERNDVDVHLTIDYLGYDGAHPGIAEEPKNPNEIVLRIAVTADSKGAIHEFGEQALPIATSGPPHVTQVRAGRPKPKDVLAFWPCTVPKEYVEARIEVADTSTIEASASASAATGGGD